MREGACGGVPGRVATDIHGENIFSAPVDKVPWLRGRCAAQRGCARGMEDGLTLAPGQQKSRHKAC